MADREAAIIAKELKASLATLRENLSSRDPWDKEIEFQRKNVQKQYLLLLLNYPYTREAKDVENHLWMQTTYSMITSYKQRISEVEQTVHGSDQQNPRGKKPNPQQRHGPVEHRKLLQRFKQFLANEERFWTQIVTRLHRQFVLTEADSSLASLDIITAGGNANKDDTTDSSRPDRPAHFGFPTEPSEPCPPATSSQRANRLATLSKALICLGDLARYREQYSEPSRRQDDHRRGGRRGGRQNQTPAEAKAKTYERERACYERARNLVPHDGNASHQLAILASYKRDTFDCLVHYYRALCVRMVYEPAAGNMKNVLAKFIRTWIARRSKAAGDGTSGAPSRDRLQLFKDDVTALHAMWEQGSDSLGDFPDFDKQVAADFTNLLTDRALPIDVITKVVILAQGAYWHHKPTALRSLSEAESPHAVLFARIFQHLLSLCTCLFQVGIAEFQESSKITEHDPAMRITAVFRRMLPALRLVCKWLRAQPIFNVLHTAAPNAFPSAISDDFQASFATFSDGLLSTFPPSRLPRLNRALEEDMELSGYLPLGGLLIDNSSMSPEDSRDLEEVHPNEEQLMRIWDVWHDISLLKPQSIHPRETQPVQPQQPLESIQTDPSNSRSMATSKAHDITRVDSTWGSSWRSPQDEDARTETTDPVGDAFRQVLLASDTESEQDEIVWNPRPTQSPSSPSQPAYQQSRVAHSSPTGRIAPPDPYSSVAVSHASSAHSPGSAIPMAHGNTGVALPHTPKTTAQDLLANVLGSGRTPAGRTRRVSQASPAAMTSSSSFSPPESVPFAQSHLLFGGTNPSAPFGSIWSASPSENSLNVHHRHGSHPAAFPASSSARVLPVQQQPLLRSSPQTTWSGSPDAMQHVAGQRTHLHSSIGYGSAQSIQPHKGHRRISSTAVSALPYPPSSMFGEVDAPAIASGYRGSPNPLLPSLHSMHLSPDVPASHQYNISTSDSNVLPLTSSASSINGFPFHQELRGVWGGAG